MNETNSILFLTSARTALCDLVEVSESADPKYVLNMKHFIRNEASDYQVMSLLMDGELPNQKINLFEEDALFERFREGILYNFSEMSDVLGDNVAKSLIYEVGPVSQYGIDTATPILEHLIESGALISLLEAPPGDPKKLTKLQRLKGGAGGALTATGKGMRTGAAWGTTGAVKQIRTGFTAAKDAKAAGKTFAKAQGPGINSMGKEILKGHAKDARAGAGQMARGGGKILAVGAALAATLYGAKKAYNRFAGKAAQSCRGRQGADRKMCVQNFKNQGIKAQMSAIRSGMAKCSSTNNPAKCKATINNKIQKLQSKLR